MHRTFCFDLWGEDSLAIEREWPHGVRTLRALVCAFGALMLQFRESVYVILGVAVYY